MQNRKVTHKIYFLCRRGHYLLHIIHISFFHLQQIVHFSESLLQVWKLTLANDKVKKSSFFKLKKEVKSLLKGKILMEQWEDISNLIAWQIVWCIFSWKKWFNWSHFVIVLNRMAFSTWKNHLKFKQELQAKEEQALHFWARNLFYKVSAT